MKKLITLLLTQLMIFTLLGCNSNKEEPPVVNEPEIKEEVVESKPEETILDGYVDAEDGTLTDELKDIFNKALEGLMGASYEPVELVATQVVAGTNYKFLANGTKTTNPITSGTYYITIYKDLQGNVELLDIETIEEKQEEVISKDITQMFFWVVVYDQFGNEISRTTAKYGATIKDPDGNDVVVKGNTYIHTSVNYPSSKNNDNPTPTPPLSECPYAHTGDLYYITTAPVGGYYKGYFFRYTGAEFVYQGEANIQESSGTFQVGDWVHLIISTGEWHICEFDGDGTDLVSILEKGDIITIDSNEYRLLKDPNNDHETLLMSMFNLLDSTTSFGANNVYPNSNLDTVMNNWYNGLETGAGTLHDAIKQNTIVQYKYINNESEGEAVGDSVDRYVYALDIADVREYFECGTNAPGTEQLKIMFWGSSDAASGKSCWLRSAANHESYAWRVYGSDGSLSNYTVFTTYEARAAFTIDLDKVIWSKKS